jgi:hypothetical protein
MANLLPQPTLNPIPSESTEDIKLSNIPVTVVPPPVSTTLPEIKTMAEVKVKHDAVDVTEDDLIKTSKVLDKLHAIEASDLAAEVARLDEIRKAEIAKKIDERNLLKAQFQTTHIGRGCIALGITLFLDIFDSMNTDDAKNKLCNSPDEFVVYVISTIIDKIGKKIGKVASKATGYFKRGLSTVVDKAGNIVQKKNIAEKATNAAGTAIDSVTKSSLGNFATILKRGLPLLILPLKLAIAPFLPAVKISCDTLQFHKVLTALLRELDHVYILMCGAPTYTAIMQILLERSKMAGEKLQATYVKAKEIGSQVRNTLKKTFTKETAIKAGQGIKSGFLASGKFIGNTGTRIGSSIRNSANRTFKIRRSPNVTAPVPVPPVPTPPVPPVPVPTPPVPPVPVPTPPVPAAPVPAAPVKPKSMFNRFLSRGGKRTHRLKHKRRHVSRKR